MSGEEKILSIAQNQLKYIVAVMYLIANCQFGLSDEIVYCSELGDGWRL